MDNLGQCSEKVYSNYRWDFGGHRCQLKSVVIEDGKPYCKRHCKASKEAKNAKFNAKVETLMEASRREWERKSTILDITDGFATEKLKQYKDTIREFIGRL